MKPDKMEKVFDLQLQLDLLMQKRPEYQERTPEQVAESMAVALMHEAAEVHELFSWKPWKNRQHLDHAAIIEELADVLHFVTSICLCLGYDASDLYREYIRKNRENRNRQMGKSEKPGYSQQEQHERKGGA